MREESTYFVYILASGRYGTLYIGVTNNLLRRVVEHREGRGGQFTKKYNVTQLMWFQPFGDIEQAIQREKSLKRWPRAWKTNLIERSNPDWHDLYPAMQKYEPRGPLTPSASGTMGPGQLRHPPAADGLAQDDS
jgi:putative endonuclease